MFGGEGERKQVLFTSRCKREKAHAEQQVLVRSPASVVIYQRQQRQPVTCLAKRAAKST
jgi:hypothetical protein